jgi:hypothetical protein
VVLVRHLSLTSPPFWVLRPLIFAPCPAASVFRVIIAVQTIMYDVVDPSAEPVQSTDVPIIGARSGISILLIGVVVAADTLIIIGPATRQFCEIMPPWLIGTHKSFW